MNMNRSMSLLPSFRSLSTASQKFREMQPPSVLATVAKLQQSSMLSKSADTQPSMSTPSEKQVGLVVPKRRSEMNRSLSSRSLSTASQKFREMQTPSILAEVAKLQQSSTLSKSTDAQVSGQETEASTSTPPRETKEVNLDVAGPGSARWGTSNYRRGSSMVDPS